MAKMSWFRLVTAWRASAAHEDYWPDTDEMKGGHPAREQQPAWLTAEMPSHANEVLDPPRDVAWRDRRPTGLPENR